MALDNSALAGQPSAPPAAEEFTGSSTPASPASTGGQATGNAEPTYDVTINGRAEKVPLSELLKGYSRTQDYTQKTQRLASERQQIQQQVSEYENALREVQGFLQDRNRVAQYLQAMGQPEAAAAAAAGEDPMALLTRGEARQLMQGLMQQAAPSITAQTQQELNNLRLELATREYKTVFDNKISQLQDQYPGLKRLGARGAAMVRMEAMNQQPQSVEAAMEALEYAAQSIDGDFGNILRQSGPQPTNPALMNGIEPRGGQGPMPTPQGNFKSLRDPRLREQIMQDLIAGTSGRDGTS